MGYVESIKVCKETDSIYPNRLKESGSSPDKLYYIGDISICDSLVVAVIGKRDVDISMSKIAEAVGGKVSKENYTVINGLAMGCDTYAIKGSLSNGGKVIAVMPCGLDIVYPPQNQDLFDKIIACGGCIISEYPVGTQPERYFFVQRNRIQAALASKIVVIDADREGGTMQTVKFAQRLRRPIGCINKADAMSTGNQYLLQHSSVCPISDERSLDKFLSEIKYEQLSFK